MASATAVRAVAATAVFATATASALEERCISRPPNCHPLCESDDASSFGDPTACGDDSDWTRGAIWPGGELLASFLTPALVRGRRVLELGCGTGIAGLAAADLGAAEIVLTDAEIDGAVANAARHSAEIVLTDAEIDGAVANAARHGTEIAVRTLAWGDAAALAALRPPFDLVLAADVVYPASDGAIGPLLATLSGAGGLALVAYVEREAATTARLHAALCGLRARCRRVRTARRRAWIYALDRWGAAAPAAGCAATPLAPCDWVAALDDGVT